MHSKDRVRPLAPASAPANGIPSRWVRARLLHPSRTIRTSPTEAVTIARSCASIASPATRKTSAPSHVICPAHRQRKRNTASDGPIRSSSHRPTRASCSSQRRSFSRAWTVDKRGESSARISRATIHNAEGAGGGPVDLDQTGVETFPDIASLAVSPLDGNSLGWLGGWSGARYEGSRRSLDARHAARAPANGADQLDRAITLR